MTIWLVKCHCDYEGNFIHGIYTSFEQAFESYHKVTDADWFRLDVHDTQTQIRSILLSRGENG